MWNGVESVCYIHLKHHLIKVDIQNNSNTKNGLIGTNGNLMSHYD
jgi:hypothetical protein